MKTLSASVALVLSCSLAAQLQAADSARNASTIVLDATGVKNLRIQTAVAEEADFEESVFSLGRIEARPASVAAVSSRISGRIISLNSFPGDRIEAGAEVAKVESRQPGNPSPVIPLTAPIGGIVSRLDVRLGDPVEPDKALLEISDLAEVYAIARVPESIAGRLKPGAKAYITVSAWPDEKLEGDLLRFGTSADVLSGTVDAIFRLTNNEGRLRPGMRAEFSIVVAKRSGVVSVPRDAIQGEPSKRFVYVRDFNLPNAFVKASVVVGQSNDRFTEIVSGLFPADEVVTQGAYSLAFAGGGTVSLKEALDAAHGHAHAEDGSELKESGGKSAGNAGHDHDHDHDHAEGGSNPFWMILSGVLFVLLLIVSLRKRTGSVDTTAVAPKPNASAK